MTVKENIDVIGAYLHKELARLDAIDATDRKGEARLQAEIGRAKSVCELAREMTRMNNTTLRAAEITNRLGLGGTDVDSVATSPRALEEN